jgi:hypothetical protein
MGIITRVDEFAHDGSPVDPQAPPAGAVVAVERRPAGDHRRLPALFREDDQSVRVLVVALHRRSVA